MFKVKPSPFVLDEIDASLDDMNVDRFLDIMADYKRYVVRVNHSAQTNNE